MSVSKRSRNAVVALAAALTLAQAPALRAFELRLTPSTPGAPAEAMAHAWQWVRSLWDGEPAAPKGRTDSRPSTSSVRAARGADGVVIDPNGSH